MSSLLLPSLKFDCFLLNFFGCDIVEGFHGKTEFAVFDGDDFTLTYRRLPGLRMDV